MLVDGLLVGVEAGDLVLEQVHPFVGLLCVRSGDSAPVGKLASITNWFNLVAHR